jgi:hypothetical protein
MKAVGWTRRKGLQSLLLAGISGSCLNSPFAHAQRMNSGLLLSFDDMVQPIVKGAKIVKKELQIDFNYNYLIRIVMLYLYRGVHARCGQGLVAPARRRIARLRPQLGQDFNDQVTRGDEDQIRLFSSVPIPRRRCAGHEDESDRGVRESQSKCELYPNHVCHVHVESLPQSTTL